MLLSIVVSTLSKEIFEPLDTAVCRSDRRRDKSVPLFAERPYFFVPELDTFGWSHVSLGFLVDSLSRGVDIMFREPKESMPEGNLRYEAQRKGIIQY
jgi:hypothetical protein